MSLPLHRAIPLLGGMHVAGDFDIIYERGLIARSWFLPCAITVGTVFREEEYKFICINKVNLDQR